MLFMFVMLLSLWCLESIQWDQRDKYTQTELRVAFGNSYIRSNSQKLYKAQLSSTHIFLKKSYIEPKMTNGIKIRVDISDKSIFTLYKLMKAINFKWAKIYNI